MKNKKKPIIPLKFNSIFRLGYYDEDIDDTLPVQFSALAVEETSSDSAGDGISEQTECILQASQHKLIEIIIIPVRYFADWEVLQTIQMREVAHQKKQGIGVVIAATQVKTLLDDNLLSRELLQKVYKISTIRHGFDHEKSDENADLLQALALRCITGESSVLTEVVIRACHSAGSIDYRTGESVKSAGRLKQDSEQTECDTGTDEETSRAFLCGNIGKAGTPDYNGLKSLTIRTQTVSVKDAIIPDSSYASVLYSMRKNLDDCPELRCLSVKAYYNVVNPVPEKEPSRMGLWWSNKRPADMTHPKAVRLISPDCQETVEKPNHLTRRVPPSPGS